LLRRTRKAELAASAGPGHVCVGLVHTIRASNTGVILNIFVDEP